MRSKNIKSRCSATAAPEPTSGNFSLTATPFQAPSPSTTKRVGDASCFRGYRLGLKCSLNLFFRGLKEKNRGKLPKLFKRLLRTNQGPVGNFIVPPVLQKDPIVKHRMGDQKHRDDVLTEEEVVKVMRGSLSEKLLEVNYSLGPVSENPMGFLGEHYRLEVEVDTELRKRKFSYFLKRIPTEVPEHKDYALKTRAFYKEIELYKTLFADLKNAQKDLKNPTKWHPECFYSRGSDLFVLEDLTAEGYYMYPERSFLDEEHAKASLRAMAAMHAASIVFEEKFNRGEVRTSSPGFEGFVGGKARLGDIYAHLTFETEASDVKGHPGNTYHEAGMGGLLKIAELLPGYSEEEKQRIRGKLPEVVKRYFQLVKTSDRFKNVFLHGDLWANNILFRKDEKGKVKDALVIDFQLARYAPPAHDVMMFLHLVQSKKFREGRQQHLLRYYHEEFAKELEKNSLEAETLFPWETFLESCNFYEDLGLLSKLFYFQMILAPTEITSKFLSSPELFTKNFLVDRTEMVVECFLKDAICQSRMTEAMTDVINKFILQQK